MVLNENWNEKLTFSRQKEAGKIINPHTASHGKTHNTTTVFSQSRHMTARLSHTVAVALSPCPRQIPQNRIHIRPQPQHLRRHSPRTRSHCLFKPENSLPTFHAQTPTIGAALNFIMSPSCLCTRMLRKVFLRTVWQPQHRGQRTSPKERINAVCAQIQRTFQRSVGKMQMDAVVCSVRKRVAEFST